MVYFDWLFGYGYGSDLRDKLKGDPEVYQTLKRVVRGTLADPSWQPQSLPAADDISSRSGQMKPFQIFLLCHLLISAVDADEHEDVLQLLAELEGELDSIEAQSWFVKAQFVPAYEKSRSVAYRQFNDELMRLQPLTAKRTVEVELSEEIHAVYIELLTKCRPEAKRYLKTWKDISGMEVQFQKGEAPSPGNGAVIYYATAAMSNLIDNLLSGDDPSSENIKRANDVANKLVKKYRSWQSHTARASAQVVARDFEGAAKSIALAKAKIQTEEQEEILAKLETEMKELQKKAKAAQPKP